MHKIFNIGNNTGRLTDFMGALEKTVGNVFGRKIEFKRMFESIKPGDVPATYAFIDLLCKEVGFKSKTSLGKRFRNLWIGMRGHHEIK